MAYAHFVDGVEDTVYLVLRTKEEVEFSGRSMAERFYLDALSAFGAQENIAVVIVDFTNTTAFDDCFIAVLRRLRAEPQFDLVLCGLNESCAANIHTVGGFMTAASVEEAKN